MFDQSLIQSGFDAEILLGERQLTAVLLALVDAGTIPMVVEVGPSNVPLGLRGPVDVDRTYEPHPDAPGLPPVQASLNPFQVEILFDHPTGADVRVHVVVDFEGLPFEGDLFISMGLATEHDDTGTLTGAALNIAVVDVESPAFPFVETTFDVDKATILATIQEKVDRAIDLGGIGAFKRIHDVAFQKLLAEGDHPAAFGLYVNLRLQDGPAPEDLKAARGDLAAARNFLPAGSDSAMASRPGLYADVARDGFNRFAEIDEDGNVSHPWHRSPFKPASETIGSIIGVSVAPIPNTNTLKVDVEVEYEIDDFFDPNAHLVLELTPAVDDNGTLKWNVNVDFHGSVAVEIIGFLTMATLFTGFGALIGLGLGAAAVAFGVIGGSLGDLVTHLIVDEVRSGRIERKVDAGIPDVVSGRVEVAQRRWDPFYTTHHQVATRPDGAIVNAIGVALWGRAVLDRSIEVVPHAVIRDKKAAAPSPPTHLRYRVDDAEAFADDLRNLAPGTDRRPFERHDPIGEPTLFQLEIEQVVKRIAERRIVSDLAYVAKRIDMRQHQVHSILAISEREIRETRNGVIAAFEAETRTQIETDEGPQIRATVKAQLAAEGDPADLEDLDRIVEAAIAARVAGIVQAFADGPLVDPRTEQALLPLLRFDLPPENLAALQEKKILHLVGLQIVTQHAPGHEGFKYYRDKPDFFKPDNLLSLPRYRQTPEGPQFL
ncbi:MAG: hypothetical protein U0575_09530 [Phycisphaerales bacterium]